MHNIFCFWKPFRSVHVNQSQYHLKSPEKQFLHNVLSIWAKLSYKKLLLVRFEILGRLFNTLTLNHVYLRPNRMRLLLPFQIQKPGKLKTFTGLFVAVFKSALISNVFKNN